MKNLKTISILIPDGEDQFLFYVVNCLSLVKNLNIFVISSKKAWPMRFSRFITKYIYYAKSTDADWIQNIDLEIEKNDINIILPVFEDGFKKLLENQIFLKHKDKLCSLPSLDNFNTAGNKGLLCLHMEKNNIPFPKSVVVNINELPNIKKLKFPIIIKPVNGTSGGDGIKFFKTSKVANSFFNKNFTNSIYLVQEYIEGYDIDCSVLCKEGEVLVYTIQKGNLQGKSKFAPNIGIEFLYREELYRVVESLMKSLNWSGVAHIDMRYDLNEKTYKVIEINTRFWLTVDLSALAGVNFPYLYCLSSLKKEFSKPQAKSASFLTLKGVVKKIKTNPLFIFKFRYIYNNTSFRFAFKDPLPMMYKFILSSRI